MPQPTRQAIVRWAACVLLVALVIYPLSYAPAVRIVNSREPVQFGFEIATDGSKLPMYRPLDWLIDNTPLDQPFFAWARLWDVERDFENARIDRLVMRLFTEKKAFEQRGL